MAMRHEHIIIAVLYRRLRVVVNNNNAFYAITVDYRIDATLDHRVPVTRGDCYICGSQLISYALSHISIWLSIV